MGRSAKNIYLSNELLLREIAKSKELGVTTPELLKAFQILIERVGRKFSYYHETDREDCQQEALIDLYLYHANFDVNKSSNAFAYCTQICKMAYAKGFHKLYPNIRLGVKITSIDKVYSDSDSIRQHL